jgi:5-(aminomethyl)-3-furanmethanol phosphate kinase
LGIVVVKVGGSLALQPEKLQNLCRKLAESSKKHMLVLVPGGGEFADIVRQLDKRFSLSKAASHRMAILGMDQYGWLLTDLIPNAVAIDSLDETAETLALGKLPVFLPSKLMFHDDPFENSWDVTSDSIALYLAGRLGARRVLLVTDVDGVYTADPKVHADAKLIKKLTAQELYALKQRTSVDKFFPKLLSQTMIDCCVVNGLFPLRIEAVLEGKKALYTQISGKSS